MLLGDFNCAPASPLHRFLTSGHLRASLRCEGAWDGQRPPGRGGGRWGGGGGGRGGRGGRWGGRGRGAAGGDVAMTHALAGRLRSAYAAWGEPEVTTYHGTHQGTVRHLLSEVASIRC